MDISNSIPYFLGTMITCPWWCKSWSMLFREDPGRYNVVVCFPSPSAGSILAAPWLLSYTLDSLESDGNQHLFFIILFIYVEGEIDVEYIDCLKNNFQQSKMGANARTFGALTFTKRAMHVKLYLCCRGIIQFIVFMGPSARCQFNHHHNNKTVTTSE